MFADAWQVSKFPERGGTLVINVGEQLSAMSNNRFKATIHRVLDIGKDRYGLKANLTIEVKPHWARVVLRWVTSCELLVLL